MADYIILGLSHFGTVLAKKLYSMGENVVVVDEDREQTQKIKNFVSQAITADATDPNILEKLVSELTATVIISLGDNLEKNVMAVYHLKKFGVKRIIAKANSEDQGKVLELIGASEIVYPEKDMANAVAERLQNPNILNSLPLGENYSISEIDISVKFIGKSLADLRLRNKYKINVLAIKSTNGQKKWLVNPAAEYVLSESDTLVVLGHIDDIRNLIKEIRQD